MIELLKRLSLSLGFLHPRHSPRPYVDTDPRAARHWHNPADLVQADRIEAAAARREERDAKRDRDLRLSYEFNNAHGIDFRFAPFYIAK